MFYKDERLALFIDGSNLYAAAKALGFDIDYKLLRQEFMRRGKLVRAFYYTALLENDEYSPIRPLVDWLHYNGFTMVTKPAKEYTDSMGRRKVKGNMDIELAVDAMELAPRVDHIVLFSGDGDFRPLVEKPATAGRAGFRRLDDPQPAADDFRRAAPPGRQLHRARRAEGSDRATAAGAAGQPQEYLRGRRQVALASAGHRTPTLHAPDAWSEPGRRGHRGPPPGMSTYGEHAAPTWPGAPAPRRGGSFVRDGTTCRGKEICMPGPELTLYLAAPRGFCAGVDRAIKIVEMALEKWGAPVYVRHEIVHNRYVVDGLRARGAIFVEELDDCPEDRPVIFSAHGVPKSVPAEARQREMIFVDATCPLVSKVHNEAARHHDNGLQMVMIGHEGHPETIGTMGQLPAGEVLLVETVDDVATLDVRDPERLAYVTQTTLSVDDTAGIVAALKARFPAIVGPHKEDICYATTNRQEAVKAIAPRADALLVVGAPNSSNSKRLVEVAARAGCGYAQLIQRAGDIDWRALDGIRSVGLTAGASAPEGLVEEVIDAFRARYDVRIETVTTAEENVEFKVPRVLREPA